MTTALLDRLNYHCEIVETGNESWRSKSCSLKAKAEEQTHPHLPTLCNPDQRGAGKC